MYLRGLLILAGVALIAGLAHAKEMPVNDAVKYLMDSGIESTWTPGYYVVGKTNVRIEMIGKKKAMVYPQAIFPQPKSFPYSVSRFEGDGWQSSMTWKK